MQKKLWRALGVCSTVLLASNAAFAEPSCPEGMREFVDTETQERVCIPAAVMTAPASAQTDTNQDAAKAPDSVAATNAVPSDEQASTASQPALAEQQQPRDNAQNPPAQTVVVAQANAYSGVVDVDYGDGMGSNAGTKSREEEIRESVRRSGGTLELGMGYGFLANLNIHVAGGYHYQASDSIASFGFYLDMNFKPGQEPLFAMDITVDPTLHITKGRFRFGVGLGIGAYLKKNWVDGSYLDEYGYHNDYHSEVFAAFELKPRLSFDWFLSTQAYFGASVDIPLVISKEVENNIEPMVNLDAHIGFKF